MSKEDDVYDALGLGDEPEQENENFEEDMEASQEENTNAEQDNEEEEIELETEPEKEEDDAVYEFDISSDIDDDGEVEQDLSEKQEALFDYLNKTVEIDGVSVDLTNIDMLDKVIERGISSIKKNDIENEETRAITSLKQNGIDLTSEKMNLIIATARGDEQAAAKLIATAGLDADRIADLVGGYDATSILEYNPPSFILDNSAYKMQRVVEEMYEDDSGKKALEYINKWDDTSRRYAADNPQIIYAVREMFRRGKEADIAREIKHEALFGKEALSNYDHIRFTNASNKLFNNTIKKIESKAKQQAIRTKIPKTFRNKFDYKTKKVKLSNADIMSMSDEEFEEYYQKYVNRK